MHLLQGDSSDDERDRRKAIASIGNCAGSKLAREASHLGSTNKSKMLSTKLSGKCPKRSSFHQLKLVISIILCARHILVLVESGASAQFASQRAQRLIINSTAPSGNTLQTTTMATTTTTTSASTQPITTTSSSAAATPITSAQQPSKSPTSSSSSAAHLLECPNGLLTFELLTGFIYKPSSGMETLSMMPSTLQLTDCLDYCLHNSSCLAINFEMGLCVLLAQSARQNQHNLFTSQFPVFTIYAEKKCLLSDAGGRNSPQQQQQLRGKRKCQRAWTFERVAGYEMKTRPRRRLAGLVSKEHCMEACLLESEFECRSANWFRQSGDCHLSDQDRHSISQSEAGDQRLKGNLGQFYGPANSSLVMVSSDLSSPIFIHQNSSSRPSPVQSKQPNSPIPSRSFFLGSSNLLEKSRMSQQQQQQQLIQPSLGSAAGKRFPEQRSLDKQRLRMMLTMQSPDGLDLAPGPSHDQLESAANSLNADDYLQTYYGAGPDGMTDEPQGGPALAQVDYLENNCVYEPNKLCEFRKLQNRVLKTVDSIYQDVATLEECKQKCLNAPYRCYSFDYGDTSERVCRTSHLDQASLMSVRDPYLDVVGAITYELASCFNVSIQCRAKEMVALVSASKMFKGKIYAKSRPSTCVNDVKEALKFELSMRYQDDACNVRASSNSERGVFSQDLIIQHHDRIVTTQDVGLSVYCHYDLGNRSVTTQQLDIAIERIPGAGNSSLNQQVESKQPSGQQDQIGTAGSLAPSSSGLSITGLATTVVKSPNVTMRITDMNGQPVSSATVGDRLALMFEIKEKSSPFGIFVREIVAMDGRQLLAALAAAKSNSSSSNQISANKPAIYHYAGNNGPATGGQLEPTLESIAQAQSYNSIQFIDSNGCPTDSNLMGPLVRLDPHGHRLLAPFDAFKFPASDMVFFRAVVSSCVAECKPSVCANSASPGSQTALDSSPLAQPNSLYGAELLADTSEHDHFDSANSILDSRTTMLLSTMMPAAASATHQQVTTPIPSSLAPPATTLKPQLKSSPAPNLLEFHPIRASQSGTVATTLAPYESTISGERAKHNHQMPDGSGSSQPPRERSSPLIMSSGQEDNDASDLLTTVPGFARLSSSTIKLSTSTSTMAPQEGLERQQQQQNVTVQNNHLLGHQLPPRRNSDKTNSLAGQGRNQSNLHEPVHDQDNTNPLLTDHQRQTISDLLISSDSSLRAIFAAANQVESPGDEQRSPAEQQRTLDILNRLISRLALAEAAKQQVNSSNSIATTTTTAASTIDDLLDLNQIQQQTGNFGRILASTSVETNDSLVSTMQKSRNLQQSSSTNGSSPGRSKGSSSARERINHQQALADSYLGAYQSMGKRRRKRQLDDALLGSSSDYVFMDQAQPLLLATKKNSNAIHESRQFTHGTVEMYHCTNGQDRAVLSRNKRQIFVDVSSETKREQEQQAAIVAAAAASGEELVVQSIKILDRLQFEDEQSAKRQQAIQLKRSPPPHSKLSLSPFSGKQQKFNGLKDSPPASAPNNEQHLESSSNQELGSPSNPTATSFSALGIFLVAMFFVFVQISMVLLCLVDWNDRFKRHSARAGECARLARGGKTPAHSDISLSMQRGCCPTEFSISSICSSPSSRCSTLSSTGSMSSDRSTTSGHNAHLHLNQINAGPLVGQHRPDPSLLPYQMPQLYVSSRHVAGRREERTLYDRAAADKNESSGNVGRPRLN